MLQLTLCLVSFVGSPAYTVSRVGSPSRAISRVGPVAAQAPQTELPESPQQQDDVSIWRRTGGGLRFREVKPGAGVVPETNQVVSVHYTVRFSESGDLLGSTRGRLPLLFAKGKHDVPIFDDAVREMRVGSSIQVIVPASSIPGVQTRNVPRDQDGENLIVEMELLGVQTGLGAVIPSALPPGSRRMTIARGLFALSFLPYLLPEDLKPDAFRFHDVSAIHAAHEAAQNSVWLGGAAMPLDSLFQ